MQLSADKAIKFLTLMQITRSYLEKAVEDATGEQVATQGRWIVEGYGSTDDLDAQGHIVAEEAIKMGADTLKEYNTVLYNHDANRPIGQIVKAEAQNTKLFLKIAVSKSEPSIWEKIKDGTLSKFSIRGRVTKAEPVILEGTDTEVLVIKGMELFEVSVVSVPANVKAKALSWYIEKAIKDLGTEEVLAILKGGEPIVEKKNSKLESALSALGDAEKELTDQEGKDQIASVLRGLKALHERLAGGKAIESDPVVESPKEPVEGLTEIISQLQGMVKQVLEGAAEVKASLDALQAVKAEISKMNTDIVAIADKFSIRKGQGPADVEPARTDSVDDVGPIALTKNQPGFKKLKPGDKLQKVLEAAVAGKQIVVN